MTDIDDTIRAGLDADDRAFLDRLNAQESGLFSQLGGVLGGPLGGWAKLVFAIAVLLGLVMLWAIWNLVQSTDVDQATFWAVVLTGILVVQGFVKEWLFSRMNMLSILREVKRLQVQVALLREGAGG